MLRQRLTRATGALAFALPLVLAACSAPASTTDDGTRGPAAGTVQATPACPPSPFRPGDQVASNYTIGFENYRRGDYCLALPYLRWVAQNDPLYTGAEPSDRNFRRLADTYEQIAARVDSANTTLRRAYLDSSLAVMSQRQAALRAANLPVDEVEAKLDESRFYLTYAADYPNGRARSVELALQAFRTNPEALTDYQLNMLAQQATAQTERDSVMHVLNALRLQADDAAYITGVMRTAQRSPSMEAFIAAVAPREEQFTALGQIYAAGVRSQDLVRPYTVAAYELGRYDIVDQVGPLVAADSNDTAMYHRALAARAARAGNVAEAMGHFGEALTRATAPSEQRDIHYQMAALQARSGQTQEAYAHLGEALAIDASHGPSLYLRAQLIANSVPASGTPAQRAAYWCAADLFQQIANLGDPVSTSAARRAAFRYNGMGPASSEYAAAGWRAGQRVETTHGFGPCSTTVR